MGATYIEAEREERVRVYGNVVAYFACRHARTYLTIPLEASEVDFLTPEKD